MKITLYKNCCLNDKYQEVFYNTKLETYLNSLTKLSLTLNNVFYENDMEIVFDYDILTSEGLIIRTDNIYDFNYVKIEEINGSAIQPDLVRYCFIKHIEVKNGCVYVETKEDVWSSFSAKMQGTNTCVLVSSRKTTYGTGAVLSPLKLPYDYDGNNTLEISKINGVVSTSCYLIAELQFYQLTNDKWTKAFSRYYMVAKGTANKSNRIIRGDKSLFLCSREQAYSGIINLISHALDKKYYCSDTFLGFDEPYDYNYKIGNIYIIPSSFDLSLFLRTDDYYWTSDAERNDYSSQEEGFNYNMPGWLLYELKNPDTWGNNVVSYKELLSITIPNNYKNYSIGPITNQIRLENNGTSIQIKILATVSSNSFNLYMNIQNQFFEITEDYAYIAPYESIDASEFQQRKISWLMKNNSLDFSIFSKSVDISNQQNKIVGGVGKAVANYKQGNIAGMFGGIEQAVSAAHETITDIGSIVKLSKDKELVNTPKYSNIKGSGKNSSYSYNYLNGIVILKINPDNNEFVKCFVDNFGYDCYYFINSQERFEKILKTDLYNAENFHYNIVRISSPNVYGKFTNDIANALNKILETGVKIWYDATKTDDPYTNGLLT